APGYPHPSPLPLRWAREFRQTLSQQAFGYGTFLLVGIVVGGPLAAAMAMSFRVGLPGRTGPLTLQNFRTAYLDPTLLGILANTAGFAAGTVLVALLFAVPLVWLVNRTDLPGKSVIFILTVASLLVPVFLGAMGWILMFSPEVGLANQLAKA